MQAGWIMEKRRGRKTNNATPRGNIPTWKVHVGHFTMPRKPQWRDGWAGYAQPLLGPRRLRKTCIVREYYVAVFFINHINIFYMELCINDRSYIKCIYMIDREYSHVILSNYTSISSHPTFVHSPLSLSIYIYMI